MEKIWRMFIGYFYDFWGHNRNPWWNIWSHSKAWRDLLLWNWNRKYKAWLSFADKHALFLNVTQRHIAQYLPNSQSAKMLAALNTLDT